jgi:hypothetical protein
MAGTDGMAGLAAITHPWLVPISINFVVYHVIVYHICSILGVITIIFNDL